MTTYTGDSTTSNPAFKGTTAVTNNAIVGIGTSATSWSSIYGESNSLQAAAVHGVANGTQGYALYGNASVAYSSGYGCVAYGDAYYGIGVYGQGKDAIVGYAMVGHAIYGHQHYGTHAGYFIGKLEVTNGDMIHSGTGTKSFRIDHPLDPENKFLLHACVESPEMKNIYDGSGTADASGELTVQLPSYFEALNSDYRYQLTAIGKPAPGLHIKQEITKGQFVIAGAAAGQKICWQVTGTRSDPSAKAKPFAPEQDKSDDERGLFLAPEAHGKTADKGIAAKKHNAPPPHPLLPANTDKPKTDKP